MDIKLKWPFCRILAIAKYNFSPTESNQLPLKEGCTLKILSKEGDQKGWWKGQIGDKVIDFILLNFFNNYKTLQKYIYFNTYFQIGFFPKVYVQEHSQCTLKISN